jgi:hypothetical protein
MAPMRQSNAVQSNDPRKPLIFRPVRWRCPLIGNQPDRSGRGDRRALRPGATLRRPPGGGFRDLARPRLPAGVVYRHVPSFERENKRDPSGGGR